MDSCLTVLEPVVEPVAGTALTAPRPERLDGLVLGVLDNGKPNSDRFLAVLAARLQEDHDLAGVVVERKPSIGKLAPDALVDALAGRCDLILTGVGDCAGCCSCSTHNSTALERRGIPAAVVCTTEFVAARPHRCERRRAGELPPRGHRPSAGVRQPRPARPPRRQGAVPGRGDTPGRRRVRMLSEDDEIVIHLRPG
ncbi:MAG: UGSC family (seleno)protein [Egibacteraceae bacterium]